MSEHDHKHDHPHEHEVPGKPVAAEDAGSQALSEALGSSFVIVRILMVLLVIAFLASGVFVVGPQEQGMVLRLGKPVGEGEAALRGPGFHWAFPAPIDEVVKVPITQVQVARSTVGWYAVTPEQEATKTEPPAGPSLNPAIDSYALTADANIMHVRGVLRYRVTDPVRFKFDFTDAPSMVTNALNEAILFASAHYTVDNALTHDVAGFRDKIQSRVVRLIDEQQLGIAVEQLTIEQKAPRQLRESFDRVLQASVQKDNALLEAKSYQNQTLSRARSEAAARINAGETDRTRLVESVAAEAKQFESLLPQYAANPELFTRLRQIETLQRVFTNAQEKFFIPSQTDGKSTELRLNLGREPEKPTVQ